MSVTVIQGTIVSAPSLGTLESVEDGFLVAEGGRIAGVWPLLPERFWSVPIEDHRGELIVQAPVDLHLHAPQWPMIGSGADLDLLDWLERYTYPTEARCADAAWARQTAGGLARELVENGTTRACIFSSGHREATRILMEELEWKGITAYVGLVSMDRNCGPLTQTTRRCIADVRQWLDECGGFPHVWPILTPRFVPACTDALMETLGELSSSRGLAVQSHLSESQEEVRWVRRLAPGRAYWEVYAERGLWHGRTVMAHCVWSDRRERRAIAESGVTVAHCPSSNLALCSGIAEVRTMLDEGLKVGLGTDIGAGDTLSMFDAAGDAVRASKTRLIMDGSRPLTAAEAWYLATSAGAAFFGASPGFAPGDPLHAVALDDRELPSPRPLTPEERLERAFYRRQEGAVRAVWSEGRKIFSR